MPVSLKSPCLALLLAAAAPVAALAQAGAAPGGGGGEVVPRIIETVTVDRDGRIVPAPPPPIESVSVVFKPLQQLDLDAGQLTLGDDADIGFDNRNGHPVITPRNRAVLFRIADTCRWLETDAVPEFAISGKDIDTFCVSTGGGLEGQLRVIPLGNPLEGVTITFYR